MMHQNDVIMKEKLLTQLPFWLETDTEGFQYASCEPKIPSVSLLAIRGKFVSLNSVASSAALEWGTGCLWVLKTFC